MDTLLLALMEKWATTKKGWQHGYVISDPVMYVVPFAGTPLTPIPVGLNQVLFIYRINASIVTTTAQLEMRNSQKTVIMPIGNFPWPTTRGFTSNFITAWERDFQPIVTGALPPLNWFSLEYVTITKCSDPTETKKEEKEEVNC